MNKFVKDIYNGIFTENPVFVLLLGLCPALGVTFAAINGVGMGLATTFVLLGSNIVIALLRKVIPQQIRIPAYIVTIATFVTIVDLVMLAYLPDLHDVLGIFIPLIVVNCLILQRAEAFASKRTVGRAIGDAIGMGLGFTVALTFLGAFRELIGNGGLFIDTPVQILLPAQYEPLKVMVQAPGSFLALGLILAFLSWVSLRQKGGKKAW